MTIRGKSVIRLADDFIRALETCNVDAVRMIYSSDARLWHNFDGKLQSVEENIKTLRWLHTKLERVKYHIVRRELLSDGYFQEHILRGVLTSGEVFSMPACAIVKILGNKIVSLDEYLDSNHIKPLLSV